MAEKQPISKAAERRKASLRNLVAGRGCYRFQKTSKGLFYHVEDRGRGKLVYEAFAALEHEIGKQRADREEQLAGVKEARATQPSTLPVDKLNYAQLKAIVDARSFYHGPVRSEVRTLPPSLESNSLLLSEAVIGTETVEVTFPDGVSMKYPKSHPLAQKLVAVQGRLKDVGIDLETDADVPISSPGLESIAEEKTKTRRGQAANDPAQADKTFLQKDTNVAENEPEEEIDESDAFPTVNGADAAVAQDGRPLPVVDEPIAPQQVAIEVLSDWHSFVDTHEEYVRVNAGDGPDGRPIYSEEPQMVERRFFAGKLNGIDLKFPVTDILQSDVTPEGLVIHQRDGRKMFIGSPLLDAEKERTDPALFFVGFNDKDIDGKETKTVQRQAIPLLLAGTFGRSGDVVSLSGNTLHFRAELRDGKVVPAGITYNEIKGTIIGAKAVHAGYVLEIGETNESKPKQVFLFASAQVEKQLSDVGLTNKPLIPNGVVEPQKPAAAPAKKTLWNVNNAAIYHQGAVLKVGQHSNGPVYDAVLEPWGTPNPDRAPGHGDGVVVISSDKDGNPVEGAVKRWHCTPPHGYRSGYDGLEMVKSADPRIRSGTLSNDPAFLVTPFSLMGSRMLGELSDAERAEVAKRVRAPDFQKALSDASHFENGLVHASVPTVNPQEQRTPAAARPSNAIRGTLVSFGEAPYKDLPENAKSYFVEIADEKDVTTKHWGLGLRDAIETGGVKPGQKVAVEKLVEPGVKKNKWTVAPDELSLSPTAEPAPSGSVEEEAAEIAAAIADQKKAREVTAAAQPIREEVVAQPPSPPSDDPKPVEKVSAVIADPISEPPPKEVPAEKPVETETIVATPAKAPPAAVTPELVIKASIKCSVRLNDKTPSARFPTFTVTKADGMEEVRTFPEEIGVVLEQQCVAGDVKVQMEDLNGEMLPTSIDQGERSISIEELKARRLEFIKTHGRPPISMPRIRTIDIGKPIGPDIEIGD